VGEGRVLSVSGVITSCIDISDGLVADLGSEVTASLALRTPWRVIMLADRGPGTQRGRALVRSDLASVYLRLARRGNSYSGSFSSDGVSFTAVGTLTDDLSNNVLVGVGTLIASACASNCDAHVPAEFDFFEIRNPGP